jgi:hypothetical protein
MRRLGTGLRAWHLMAAVAVVAVGLTATQRYTTPPVALLIIAACVGCLTWKRYREVVDSTQAGGSALSRTKKAGLFIASAARSSRYRTWRSSSVTPAA